MVPTTVPTTIVYTVCLQLQQLLHLNVIDAYDFHNMHVVIRQPETRGGPRLVFDLCVTDTITHPSYTCHKLPVACSKWMESQNQKKWKINRVRLVSTAHGSWMMRRCMCAGAQRCAARHMLARTA